MIVLMPIEEIMERAILAKDESWTNLIREARRACPPRFPLHLFVAGVVHLTGNVREQFYQSVKSTRGVPSAITAEFGIPNHRYVNTVDMTGVRPIGEIWHTKGEVH